jgi:hypothetical protein
MLPVLAYHGAGLGSWVARTVARDLLWRAVAESTRGIETSDLICLGVLAIGFVWFFWPRR